MEEIRKTRLKERIKDEYLRLQNAGKRAVEDAERAVEEDARRLRRQKAREILEENDRIKAAEPVKIEMKGFGFGAKPKLAAKSSGGLPSTKSHIYLLFFKMYFDKVSSGRALPKKTNPCGH